MLALKEWSIVCRALEEAKQSILLRKGGILEYKKGFEISQKIFLLYPTLEHQSKEYLQPNYLQEFELFLKGNDSVVQDKSNTIRILARIEAMQEFHDQTILSKLEKYHIWNEKYVRMRMKYNPKKPMNALLLRVYRLPESISVDVQPEWAGCKSWIDIELSKKYGKSYEDANELLEQSKPVINDEDFQRIQD
ncbi:MAG TPA: DUF1802 family protein, partial [Nitrososphaeraceae archaeon]|nr:DUF1802 family protein [Nitrososphaeraceae archaeon]